MSYIGKIFRHWVDSTSPKRHFTLHIIIVTVLLVGGMIIYFVEGISTQNALSEQMLHREQVIAVSGATSIGDFLNGSGRTLSVFAAKEAPNVSNASVLNKDMAGLLNTWSSVPIVAITYVDKGGIIKNDVNRLGAPELGVNVSDRTYFQWLQSANSGSYYVGSPIISRLGQTKGTYIVPLAASVFKNGEFNGTFVAVISLDSLVEKYSTPLKISDQTEVALLNTRGDFISSSIPNLEGENYMKIIYGVNFPDKNKVLEELTKEFNGPNTEGKLDLSFPDISSNGKIKRFLLAYSVIRVDKEKSWTVVIVTPATDAYLFAGPFYKDQIVFFTYLVAVITLLSIAGVTSYRIQERRYRRDVKRGQK